MTSNMSESLVKTEPTLERVKRNGQDIPVARAQDGKFAAQNKARLKQNIREVLKWLDSKVDPEGKPSELTIHEQILKRFHTAMLEAGPDDLIGLSKAYTEILKAAGLGEKRKEKVLEEADPESGKIRVILVPHPVLINPEPKPDLRIPSKPSFADEKKEPLPFIDVEIVEDKK